MLLQKSCIAERNENDDPCHNDGQKNGIDALAIAWDNIITLAGVVVLVLVHGQAASLR